MANGYNPAQPPAITLVSNLPEIRLSREGVGGTGAFKRRSAEEDSIGLPAVDRVVFARVLLLAGLGTKNAASYDLGSPRDCGAMAWSGDNSLRNEGPFLGSLAWHLLLPN